LDARENLTVCGIAGIYAYHYAANAVDRAELRHIRDHMAARGPDGLGEWHSKEERVGLGHRRLAIVDLSDRGALRGKAITSSTPARLHSLSDNVQQ
jgi:asparagine synthetase B (glutamine-hydrolysing)